MTTAPQFPSIASLLAYMHEKLNESLEDDSVGYRHLFGGSPLCQSAVFKARLECMVSEATSFRTHPIPITAPLIFYEKDR